MSENDPDTPPRLTVVTPTWNREQTVARAIESVRAQTIPDYEHLIVDDGSTDGTVESVRERYGDDPRIRVLAQDRNQGVSAARNRAIDEARAEWIGFLDSDDTWEPQFIERQLAFAETHPAADFIVADCRYGGRHGHVHPTTMSRPEWLTPNTLEHLCSGAWIQPSSTAVRTSVAQEVRFDPEIDQAEDVDFLFRLVIAGYTVMDNPETLATYESDPGGAGAERLTADMDWNRLAVHELRHKYADHCELCRQDPVGLVRRRAKWLTKQGRWREARPYLWGWWIRRPDSMTALRGLLRSLFAWR